MIFDSNRIRICLHSVSGPSGLMAWEAALSTARSASEDFICHPGRSEGGLGHTLASWLSDAGPHVALQWTMGGLWRPGEVGVRLSIAVMGSTPDQARQRVLERARQLAMWLDIHHEGEGWHPVDSMYEDRWHSQSVWMRPEAPHLQDCGLCDGSQQATERFLEVALRTGSGLCWTLRSRPLGLDLERLIGQLADRPAESALTRLSRGRPPDPLGIRRLLAMPEALPFEVALAIVGREPVDDLVRFAARESVLELGARECQLGSAQRLPSELGAHASFGFFNGSELRGLDRATAKHQLRWIAGLEEAEDLGEGASEPSARSLPQSPPLRSA